MSTIKKNHTTPTLMSAILRLSLLCVFLMLSWSALAQDTPCEKDNAALKAMYPSMVSFQSNSATEKNIPSITVKTADTNATRSAGFQRVCASTIAATPILFLFARPVTPSFHMNNVVAALDIAFIDEQGKIESIQSMQPYSLLLLKKPLYSPSRAIVAALETRPGFYADNGIVVGDTVTWLTQATE